MGETSGKRIRISAYLVLAFSLSMLLFAIFTGIGDAYPTKEGVLTGTNVNVRSGPGTEYGSLVKVSTGQKVTITGEEASASGSLWYQVQFTLNGKNYSGYIYSTYVSVTSTSIEDVPASADPAFEQRLEAAGFPESYRKYLRYLHKYHPNWQFQEVHTGLDWNTVLEKESVVGRNLVQSSSLDSWKSLEAGAYNWETGQWYGLDSSAWVAASGEVIAYFMDPRNFLTGDATILQFEALNYVSGIQTSGGVRDILEGTFMGSDSYYNIFMAAATESGVSPYHLASRALQEQGRNGGKTSSGTVAGYEGYYNFFNIGATPGGQGAVINGLIKAKAMGWTSPELSIRGGAKVIGANYINKGQNTLYFQKFDVVDGGNGFYSHQYMTNLQAPTSEAKNMKAAYKDLNNASIVFNIPIYLNMPEEPCPQPTGDGSPNNLLASLSVNGYVLTPGFDKYTQEYSLVVPADVTAITISASAIVNTASVSGTGTVSLKNGDNTVQVVCTAQNGSRRTYTINVARGNASPGISAEEIRVSANYRLDANIAGVPLGTGAAELLNNVSVSPEGVGKLLVNRDGTPNNGIVKTGDVLHIYYGNALMKQFPVVLYGDIDGNGEINILDLTYVKRHILGVSNLTGPYALAANIDKAGDGITILDLTYMKRHILGIQNISQ